MSSLDRQRKALSIFDSAQTINRNPKLFVAFDLIRTKLVKQPLAFNHGNQAVFLQIQNANVDSSKRCVNLKGNA